ncbi:hypothetical protein [Saccharicrinis sp. FJH54]|uniref:hypothetical protein n=1 Tax=Saccharicrinis sp. FJH54 TaxID=3344665 RepID=UPI0035D4398D
MKHVLIISFIMWLTGSLYAVDFEVLSDWKTAKESDGIVISYRWINISDTFKTREMKTVLFIDATPETIIKQFKSDEKLNYWTAGSRNCSVLQHKDNQWITHTTYDMPWPFTSNDLITRYRAVISDAYTTLTMECIPDFIPVQPDVSRIKHYSAYWILKPQQNGGTKVEFCTVSFTRPLFPRFIQDPVLQDIMIDSMNKFRKLSEAEQ